jgi:hypothetical protein
MRRRLTIAAAITALAVTTGCGSNVDTSAEDGSDQQGGVTSESLKASLLTSADLPGYIPSASMSDARKDNFDGCPILQRGIKSKDQFPAFARADFSKSALGPYFTEALASGTEEQAHTSLAEFGTVLSKCKTFTSRDIKGPTSYSLSPLTLPKVGDEMQAFQFNVKMQDADANAHVVVVRKGGTLITITNAAPLKSADQALTESSLSKALTKLNENH